MRNKETDMTLEIRIETAIAENTDPFTTDADIRFFETEAWNKEVTFMLREGVTLGTKIIGNFGGYTELWNGEVVTISTYDTGPSTPEVKVKWDNGSTTWLCESDIDNGSKIGYYTERAYYDA
jgi:hypothetical protein